jgi:hypothetical protein
VVILDNRILGRDYGKAFLDVLPPASRFVGPAREIPDRVGDWLASPPRGEVPTGLRSESLGGGGIHVANDS